MLKHHHEWIMAIDTVLMLVGSNSSILLILVDLSSFIFIFLKKDFGCKSCEWKKKSMLKKLYTSKVQASSNYINQN